jgi:hypothetical protein
MKAEKTKENHVGHNSGVAEKEIATTSLDDESSQSCNSNNKELG